MNKQGDATAAELGDHALYQQPQKLCDMVMKGGVTSGIVYPLAACELAKTYRFKNIGGTSAGAIAAAVIAAAEHGRHVPGGGFARIARLPAELGDGSTLFNLFQPQAGTRRLYKLVTASLGSKHGRLMRVIVAAMINFPVALVFGLLPGVLLAVAVAALEGWRLLVGAVFILITLLLGATLNVTLAAYRVAVRELPKNFFGLCSGMEGEGRTKQKALTQWLSALLERTAGIGVGTRPLTFGDLWGTDEPDEPRAVNLEVVTTSISHGRPYKIPFTTTTFWLFNPDEFRRLFPEHVVKWMVDNQRKIEHPEKFLSHGLVPLPDPANLPVVVATRMSLSFPFLISAVPLYAIDSSRRLREDRVPERCWFSDGGITSNLPVHFFDAPLPRWPTFAINLRSFHPDYPRQTDEVQNSFLPVTNRAGMREWWYRLHTPFRANAVPERPSWLWRAVAWALPTPVPVTSFANAIQNTMQSWRDNMQVYQPGYRDRVVHISIGEGEGGTNLKMPPKVTAALSERGRAAGIKLRERFAGDATIATEGWDNHRWVRYRSSMSVLEHMLKQLMHGYNESESTDRPYAELIRRKHKTPPNSYRWERIAQRTFAAEETDRLIELVERWDAQPESFQEGAPRPDPELRITPRM